MNRILGNFYLKVGKVGMCKKVGKSRKSRIARRPARAVVIPLCLVMLLYILIDLRYPEY